jgi:hypothetical protein
MMFAAPCKAATNVSGALFEDAIGVQRRNAIEHGDNAIDKGLALMLRFIAASILAEQDDSPAGALEE